MGGRIDHDHVRALAKTIDPETGRYFKVTKIARLVGCNDVYARLIIKDKLRVKGAGNVSRMKSAPLNGKSIARIPPHDHPALTQARTIHPDTVREASLLTGGFVLKSGYNSAKIGREIFKGKWKGFSVYTLTLEERATCPRSCGLWRACYGNAMHLADRIVAGRALEASLRSEIADLSRKHDRGFAVRLHVLGDFYSVDYVKMWAQLLDEHPQLHVFGFSARWETKDDPIADALVRLVLERWERFAIRFSNAPVDECATVSIDYAGHKPRDAIICPQQLGKTENCGTCALCWQSKKRIAFILH